MSEEKEDEEVKHYRMFYQNDDLVILIRTEAPADGEEE